MKVNAKCCITCGSDTTYMDNREGEIIFLISLLSRRAQRRRQETLDLSPHWCKKGGTSPRYVRDTVHHRTERSLVHSHDSLGHNPHTEDTSMWCLRCYYLLSVHRCGVQCAKPQPHPSNECTFAVP